jgi:hypothetical protein
MKTNPLDKIKKYNLNQEEAAAYKLALLWMIVCGRELKDYHYTKLRKYGDPRKSIVWKYCLKLYQETKGFVDSYELYMTAQIHVLRSIRAGEVHALIEPQCLTGKKAWKRWKFWKYLYDKKMEIARTGQELGVHANSANVIAELKTTKAFFIKEFGKEPTAPEIETAIDTHRMLVWIRYNKVSPFYVVLSKRTEGRHKELLVDTELYRSLIIPEIEEFFQKEFAYEISS